MKVTASLTKNFTYMWNGQKKTDFVFKFHGGIICGSTEGYLPCTIGKEYELDFVMPNNYQYYLPTDCENI